MFNPFGYLRHQHTLLNTIAEQNAVNDKLAANVLRTRQQLEASEKENARLRDAGNALIDERARHAGETATLRKAVTSLEAKLVELAAEFKAKDGEVQGLQGQLDDAMKERAEAEKLRDLYMGQRDSHWYELTTTLERLGRHMAGVEAAERKCR